MLAGGTHVPRVPQEDANGEHPGNAQCALPHLRWRRDALQTPEVRAARLIEQEHMSTSSRWRSAVRYLEYERARSKE